MQVRSTPALKGLPLLTQPQPLDRYGIVVDILGEEQQPAPALDNDGFESPLEQTPALLVLAVPPDTVAYIQPLDCLA